MNKPDIPPDNSFQIRCPRLGHQIYFAYCVQENFGIPCFKTLDCWYPYFPVDVYLAEKLSSDEWQQAFGTPLKPKLVSLVETIEKVTKDKP